MPAPYALPAGFAMFLAVGTLAAALHGRLPAGGVLIACAAVACAVSFAAEPVASVLLAGIGWLTVIGFSRPPYAQLRPAGPAAVHAAVVVGVTALAGAGFGLVFRWYWRRLTLVSMGRTTGMRRGAARWRPARRRGRCRFRCRFRCRDRGAGGGWRACCWPRSCCRCSPWSSRPGGRT